MKFDNLWNDLTKNEREKLMPHMIESQILHIEQCKNLAIENHKKHMSELNDWINNLRKELTKYC